MHYHCEIWTKEKPSQGLLDKIMAPHNDEGSGSDRFWDWWVVGGRYSGSHDGYDPSDDPQNIEICEICNGTGDRRKGPYKDDSPGCRHCNGCSGSGVKVTFMCVPHEEDILPLKDCKDDLTAYTLIVDKGRWPKVYHEETWNRKAQNFNKGPLDTKTVKQFLASLGITDGWLTTVDYHD